MVLGTWEDASLRNFTLRSGTFSQTRHSSYYDLQNSKIAEKSHSQCGNPLLQGGAGAECLTASKTSFQVVKLYCSSPAGSGELFLRLKRPPRLVTFSVPPDKLLSVTCLLGDSGGFILKEEEKRKEKEKQP